MSRWLFVALALILYVAGMAALLWVANLLITPFLDFLYGTVGRGGAWAMFLALLAATGLLALYLHRRDGIAAGKAGRNRSP